MEEDLSYILEIYKQPDMDNGKVLPLDHARDIFNRIKSYPNYNVCYTALCERAIRKLSKIDNILCAIGAERER